MFMNRMSLAIKIRYVETSEGHLSTLANNINNASFFVDEQSLESSISSNNTYSKLYSNNYTVNYYSKLYSNNCITNTVVGKGVGYLILQHL